MGKVARNKWAATLHKERARDRRTNRKPHAVYIPKKRKHSPAQLYEVARTIEKLTATHSSDPFFYDRAWSRFNSGLVSIDDLNAGTLD